jgi:hypothetical protein
MLAHWTILRWLAWGERAVNLMGKEEHEMAAGHLKLVPKPGEITLSKKLREEAAEFFAGGTLDYVASLPYGKVCLADGLYITQRIHERVGDLVKIYATLAAANNAKEDK